MPYHIKRSSNAHQGCPGDYVETSGAPCRRDVGVRAVEWLHSAPRQADNMQKARQREMSSPHSIVSKRTGDEILGLRVCMVTAMVAVWSWCLIAGCKVGVVVQSSDALPPYRLTNQIKELPSLLNYKQHRYRYGVPKPQPPMQRRAYI